MKRNNQIYNKSFQTQYTTKLPIPYLCGVACLNTILKLYKQISFNTPLLSVFRKYLTVGKNNVPYSTLKIDETLTIPIAYYPQINNPKQILKDSKQKLEILNIKYKENQIEIVQSKTQKQFIPSFTLWYGFDHRGIPCFLRLHKYLLSSTLLEEKFDVVVDKLNQSKNSSAILSVDPIYIGFPTNKITQTEKFKETILHQNKHNIVILEITKYNGNDVAVISNPLYPGFETGISILSLKTLESAYTGHATVLSPK